MAKIILKFIFGIFFIGAGVNHFINEGFYMKIMPSYIPFHRAMVIISGIIEIAFGLMLLIPKTQKYAAWGLILLLVAVFPANINMAVNSQLFPDISPALLYIRLPLQLVLIAWAYWYTLD